MHFREATTDDIPQMQIVRHAVQENRLSDPSLVTDADCEEFITVRGKGWVCETNGIVIGFAIADLEEENIWALFVDPEHEGKGVGKQLQQLMLDWYFEQGKNYVWLGTEPHTRAEKFYSKTGWKNAGVRTNGEIKFEMSAGQWMLKKNAANYSTWSQTYDSMHNRTRDLEAKAMQTVLKNIHFETVLELGCGTGKNTEWLAGKAKHITAVDLAADMQQLAKEKLQGKPVDFMIGDITKPWNFIQQPVDLISSSLVLEHAEDLSFIFAEAAKNIKSGAYYYAGELHPYRQYHGGKAHFETPAGMVTLECFIHHISDYMEAALQNGFNCISFKEWFDDDDKTTVPRIISLLFQKK